MVEALRTAPGRDIAFDSEGDWTALPLSELHGIVLMHSMSSEVVEKRGLEVVEESELGSFRAGVMSIGSTASGQVIALEVPATTGSKVLVFERTGTGSTWYGLTSSVRELEYVAVLYVSGGDENREKNQFQSSPACSLFD